MHHETAERSVCIVLDVTTTEPSEPAVELGTPTVSPGRRVMDALELHVPPGDFTVSEVAEKTLMYLEEVDPAVLAVWLREIGLQTLHEHLRGRLLRQRQRFGKAARARAFAVAAGEYEKDGNAQHLSPFKLTYVVNERNVRRRVADMTAEDHEFVADRYRVTADRNLLLEAFHRQVARRIGEGRTTADVLDEDTYTRLYASIVGDAPDDEG